MLLHPALKRRNYTPKTLPIQHFLPVMLLII